jgi:hypothetical protein
VLRHWNGRVSAPGSTCSAGSARWAALYAVGEHLRFAVVAMGYLIGRIAQVMPV